MPCLPLIIKSYTFQVRAPYYEGHQIGAEEAKLLNALRAKNLHRMFAPAVEEAEALEPQGVLGQEQVEELQQRLAKLDGAYKLKGQQGAKRPRAEPPRLGLLDKEAHKVALERAEQIAPKASEAMLEEMAQKIISSEAVQSEARRRVAARRKLEEQGLGALL